MKRIVFCLVALSLALPITSFAEEILSTTEDSKVESSSASTQDTEKNDEKIVENSSSSTLDSSSSETSNTIGNLYGDIIHTTLVVFQGEKVTAEMLYQDGGFHGAAFRDLKLLDEAPTDKLGKNLVNVSFMLYPWEEDQGEKQEVILNMAYTVVKTAPTYNIQFISYDSDNKQVKGKVSSVDGVAASNVHIYGDNTANYDSAPANITLFYPFVDLNNPVSTDAEGYFTLSYQDNYSFFAFNSETNDYSPVYTLNDKTFAGVSATTDTSNPVESTQSSSEKKEEKKKDLFPNTGEKKTVYVSIVGIAIILLAILFLFIKSKKNKK
ncbi:LPXTG-domain-containing protein cell wall anchor domain [Enterococcus haemoperoxidus ATCC BAA-382]|uniref:LPXTG-domain-containing protein cell wall anchor domain n=1 Tax=Enterococcus haemoperoxidus ATCC BAA-382 TaxID=1158608 RepID=R2SS64_9ENTE|nr:LPXTG cell wall anchor domain-containing protein [Enterococcus haemoperoxidus]EOH95646.1 LPXTG-domain-containing protein cell wall anchor domain [Enterococcus haemoperoxidus ATCC BAA-382]EOT60325.1 hypothetical protein I583_02971 [Enterococcus haemoperoxidus ATCC BAA-382]OJG51950.1 LPXTG-domain-containing protein cell wall anchor domain [Enterococcus haemoperoxidus]